MLFDLTGDRGGGADRARRRVRLLWREAGHPGDCQYGARPPPVAGKHACVARDHEYKRHGTLSLLAGIDLLTGQVHASVEDRHRSREFIGFLKRLDAAYSADTAIKLILDNHSAHVSKETKTWLATQRQGRFSFVFTPKHGSWLNLVEGFFSKMARSVLRHEDPLTTRLSRFPASL
jgi:transposase